MANETQVFKVIRVITLGQLSSQHLFSLEQQGYQLIGSILPYKTKSSRIIFAYIL